MSHLIMGKNCVREALKAHPERILRIYCLPGDDPLQQEFKRKKIPVETVGKGKLASLVDSESHQGIVALVEDPKLPTLREVLEGTEEPLLFLACDSIMDPQNLGAILRAAECFGVQGVIFSKNRGADLSPVVAKVSAGASELVPIFRVSNLADSLRLCKEHGFEVAIADVNPQAKAIGEYKAPDRLVLVMGSEGEGVRPLIAKMADIALTIPMKGAIDSLNVSQAAACFLSHLA